jgi:hypothetical protein
MPPVSQVRWARHTPFFAYWATQVCRRTLSQYRMLTHARKNVRVLGIGAPILSNQVKILRSGHYLFTPQKSN